MKQLLVNHHSGIHLLLKWYTIIFFFIFVYLSKVHHSKGSALSQSADMKDSIKNLPKEKVKKRSQSPKDEKTQHQSRSPVRVSKEKPLNRSRSPLNVKVVKSRKSKSPLKIKDEKPQQQSQNSNKSSNLSIQDRRQKLLEEQRQKKFDKQRAMGLLPPKEEVSTLSIASFFYLSPLYRSNVASVPVQKKRTQTHVSKVPHVPVVLVLLLPWRQIRMSR